MTASYRNRLIKSSGRKTRVFDLHPAPSLSDPISGALREIPLDRRQKYRALSYVWGTDSPNITVHLSNGTLMVTKNCSAALRQLRDKNKTQTLWIDSICISQSDEEEKSHQVALMRDIYASADCVYVWLGDRTDNSDYALDWCVDSSRDGWPLPSRVKFLLLPTILSPQDMWELTKVMLKGARNFVYRRLPAAFRVEYRADAMHDILTREWFTRMWTIQELAMAKKPLVMCGKKIITWHELITGINRSLSHRNDGLSIWGTSIPVTWYFWHSLYEKEEYSKEKVEQSYRWPLRIFDAGDLRSSIGRINTVKYICGLLLIPQFCYVAVKRYARHGFSSRWRIYNSERDGLLLAILVWVFAVISLLAPPPNMASWESGLRRGLIPRLNLMRPLRATDPRDKVFALFGILNAFGIRLDEPDYTDSAANVFHKFTCCIIEWQRSLDVLIEASYPAPMGAPSWVPDWSRPYPRERAEAHKAAGDSEPDFTLDDRHLKTSGKVLDEVDTCSHNPLRPLRMAFKTKGGRHGEGPGSTQKKDILVLISSLCVPMLLRKAGECFEVLGLAYVDGIMQGEAWPNEVTQLDHFTLV